MGRKSKFSQQNLHYYSLFYGVNYFKASLFVAVSILIGIGVALYRIADYESSSVIFKNGSWMSCKDLPLGKNDLLTAQITVFAPFTLSGEEAIYLFAQRDNEEVKLNSKNDYIVEGNIHQIHAQYWSFTIYGKDFFLVPNKENKYSVNNSNIRVDSLGNFSIIISQNEKQGNWLPSPDNTHFKLVLRIYRGEKDYVEHLDKASLPEIKIMRQ